MHERLLNRNHKNQDRALPFTEPTLKRTVPTSTVLSDAGYFAKRVTLSLALRSSGDAGRGVGRVGAALKRRAANDFSLAARPQAIAIPWNKEKIARPRDEPSLVISAPRSEDGWIAVARTSLRSTRGLEGLIVSGCPVILP